MITAASVQAVAEALALVAKCGVPPEKFERALRGNASRSATIEMKLPKMMDNDFEPHFSVKHMLKDLQIAERLADSLELKFPVTEAARDMQLAEVKNGRGDEDYSCVVRRYFPDGVPSERKHVEPPAPEPSEAPLEPSETLSEPVIAVVAEPEQAPVVVEEVGAAAAMSETTLTEPSTTAPAVATRQEGEQRSGFLRRLFNRGTDY
jgi:hypothetical protein